MNTAIKLPLKTVCTGIIICLIFLSGLKAQIRLPSLINNGMILQRDIVIPVWGWASPGEKIHIRFAGKTYEAMTGNSGKWQIKLQAMKAGGPYEMVLSASNRIILTDILIGDVWVCSGQSNMALKMESIKSKYAGVISHSANPFIRQFRVANVYSFSAPAEDVRSEGWKAASPQNVLDFTAVGYFFASALYEKYKIPVGLINSSWGGTPAEAWMSFDALKAFPQYYSLALKWQDPANVNTTRDRDSRDRNSWYKELLQKDSGLASLPWYSQQYHAMNWTDVNQPASFEEQGIGKEDGVLWFRKEIDVPVSMTGKTALLLLGNMIDQDSTYFNGVKVGSSANRYFSRQYQIPSALLKPGKNVIVVRLINRSESGGFIKDKPYKLISGKDTLELSGKWQYKVGAQMVPYPKETVFAYQPLGLYNGMIAPLINYAIKGVIWYQGEANTGKATEYRKLFPALIADWRGKWNEGNFPFLYVQLANYMATSDIPSESNWAELREAQLMTLSVPGTGMAVITDTGEWNDVHPQNKKDVGLRLALAAYKVGYGEKNVIYSGPIYHSSVADGNRMILSFKHTGSGLIARGNGELKYFAVAGTDRKFVWAHAEIRNNKVIVWNDSVPHPVAVRYAWADNPQGANLYNKEGLPASAFRTDNWIK